jgi:hypothetical protein
VRTLDDYSRDYLKFYLHNEKDIGIEIFPNRAEYKDYEINQYRHYIKHKQRLLVINTGGELGRFAIGGLPYYKIEKPKPKPIEQEVPEAKLAAPSPAVEAAKEESSSPVGLIIGIIVALLVIGGVLFVIFFFRKKKIHEN